MDPEERELQKLNAAVGDQIHEEYWVRMGTFREELGDLPLEARTGIAQAVADFLGCRVILQGAVMESIPHDPDTFCIVGHREIMRADPTLSYVVYK